MKRPGRLFLLGLLAVGVACAQLEAAVDVMHMNLSDLTRRADKIFRGTVVEITEGTVTVGGGEIPTLTYRLRVEESFAGAFTSKGDVRYADITMVTASKTPATSGGALHIPVLSGLPELRLGNDYLLVTTAPSEVGLSTMVGLGQGTFGIHLSADKQEVAVNGFGNVGLFKGMEVGIATSGPILYTELASQIRTLVSGRARGGNRPVEQPQEGN